jgi:hypothetical protein
VLQESESAAFFRKVADFYLRASATWIEQDCEKVRTKRALPSVVVGQAVGATSGYANLLPVALAAERKTVILTDSHEFATARLA